jgi:hypothetical protein
MREMYNGDNSKIALTLIAEKVGKTVPSVRAKMSSEGFYIPNEKAASTSTRTKKSDTVDLISGLVGGLGEADAEGLAKATAAPLVRVLVALTNAKKMLDSPLVIAAIEAQADADEVAATEAAESEAAEAENNGES